VWRKQHLLYAAHVRRFLRGQMRLEARRWLRRHDRLRLLGRGQRVQLGRDEYAGDVQLPDPLDL
jgi:hypothetical protein